MADQNMIAEQSPKTPQEHVRPHYNVGHWKPEDAPAIFRLEETNWAPWLQKPEEEIAEIARLYPETQLLLRDDHGNIKATVRANRINWDGDPATVPTWDAVAHAKHGDDPVIGMNEPEGNTVFLLSMNVDIGSQGQQLAPTLINEMKKLANSLPGVDHLIGPFRPNKFGAEKLQGDLDFEEYCKRTRASDGLPVDPWLRAVTRVGMHPMGVSERSMVISTSRAEFDGYRTGWKPDQWKMVGSSDDGREKWECGETGSWFVTSEEAEYIEPNLNGEIPL